MKIGHDIVNIGRIKNILDKIGDKFIERVFTRKEEENAPNANKEYYYAKRFAVKESVMKALGPEGISWQEIETLNLPSGKPFVNLYGKALSKLEKDEKIAISISDDFPMASSFIVIFKE